jgi:FdhD protein
MHDGTGPSRIWREGSSSVGSRSILEETAVALTYNGGTYAVMMTTPQDLEDFAVGFSLSEGVISSSLDVDSLEIVALDEGVELRMWLSKPKGDRLQERRRYIAGPTGRGLCGIESIVEAMRPAAVVVSGPQFSLEQIMVAMQSLSSRQKLKSRRARYTQLLSGMPRVALLPCARTLAATMRSTSYRVH